MFSLIRRHRASLLASAAGLVLAGGAARAQVQVPIDPVSTSPAAMAKARTDSARYPYVEADIDFMAGMIHHHSQALVMAGWAPSHGASSAVQRLASRIINAQRDEIHLMQQWLVDRGQPAPPPTPGPMKMKMNGMMMDMLMPGMLSDAQMKELDEARGEAFDRKFLTFMIQHHTGAVGMVNDLFNTYGAAQDEKIFKFASDVQIDQTTEITRMHQMLAAIELGIAAP